MRALQSVLVESVVEWPVAVGQLVVAAVAVAVAAVAVAGQLAHSQQRLFVSRRQVFSLQPDHPL